MAPGRRPLARIVYSLMCLLALLISPAAAEDDTAGDTAQPADWEDSGDPSSWKDSDSPSPRTELIRERYPNRSVKIERQVIQDAQDNFLNHGKWRMWDPVGNLIAEGKFYNGERDGTWVRWLRASDAKVLSTVPFRQFVGPFISQASFQNGKLHGTWTVYDSKQRKISSWEYEDGLRHGKWTWWFPNGRKMREVDYRMDDIHGQWLEWDPDGTLTQQDNYQDGRKLARKVDYHRGGKQKQSEGVYLHARLVRKTNDDWWSLTLGTYERQGKDEKHGPWATWYPSGQMRLQGEYRHDQEHGKFTWWHSNGQKAAEGVYDNGDQKQEWTWWHQNGLKSIQGEYNSGGPSGRWTWWQDDGKVAQRADFTHSKGRVVQVPEAQPEKKSSTAQRLRPTPARRYRTPR